MGKKNPQGKKTASVKDITARAENNVKGGAWYAKLDGVDGSVKLTSDPAHKA
jgi:hypothetical protein